MKELAAAAAVETPPIPPNLIPPGCERITPKLLPLVQLSQEEVDRVVARVAGGAGNVQDIYPLTPLQEGVLFHHLASQRGDPYLLWSQVTFASRALMEEYVEALNRVIARHDILRTGVVWEGLSEPVQVVWRQARLQVDEVELDAAAGDIATQLKDCFHPRHYRMNLHEAPLIRAFAAREKDSHEWVLMMLMHHTCGDRTTLEVMQEELGRYLEGMSEELPAVLPFRNFVAQSCLGVSRAEHEEFFRQMLQGVTEPTAPFELLDVQGDGTEIREGRQRVESLLSERLRRQARELGVSPASVCHLAWGVVVGSCSGQVDPVFGTVLFGRVQGRRGSERVPGLFINTLPLRIRLGHQDVRECVRQVHRDLGNLLRHEHAPLSLAQRCSEVVAPAPVFTALLKYRHTTVLKKIATGAFAGMRYLRGEERTNYPLVLSVDAEGDEFTLSVQTVKWLDPQYVCEMTHQALQSVVEALEKDQPTAVNRLPALSVRQRRELEGFNETQVDYGEDRCVQELFEERVLQCGQATAVQHDEECVSYEELNARANRVARYLRRQGVGAESRVAICMERSVEMVVGLVGILKSGGAYVPLDPEYPMQRLGKMLEDAGAQVVLIQERQRGLLPQTQARVVSLDEQWEEIASESAEKVPSHPRSRQHLAYVIYTSGSTGEPKGAMNEHRAVSNRLQWMQEQYRLGSEDRVLQKTPFSFDVSVWEFFWPLSVGACVVVARPQGHRDADYLQQLIGRMSITTLHFVPSMLSVFLDRLQRGSCGSVRRVICSGEELPVALQERCLRELPRVLLSNLYGPTEAAVDVTSWECAAEEGAWRVPIGRPIANTRMYILDEYGEAVPVGVRGELYIAGKAVGRGYLGRAGLTAERFVPDPRGRGERMYRTGDLGRYLGDGRIEYLGRNDHQVKIRGLRIEPGEIEALLSRHPQVREAAVVTQNDKSVGKRIIAYVTLREPAPSAAALREQLQQILPQYMMPSAVVPLESMPHTVSGKVDRRRLEARPLKAPRRSQSGGTRNALEKLLSEIFCTVLGLPSIDTDVCFFDAGGHSLRATRAVALALAIGVQLSIRDLFEHTTVEALASHLHYAARAKIMDGPVPVQPILRFNGQGALPPLILLPPIGRGTEFYFELVSFLPTDIPVLLAENPLLPGQDRSDEQLVAYYLDVIAQHRPLGAFCLGGWSKGGEFAIAIAQRLAADGIDARVVPIDQMHAQTLVDWKTCQLIAMELADNIYRQCGVTS